jgi:hypothetical protein
MKIAEISFAGTGLVFGLSAQLVDKLYEFWAESRALVRGAGL